jgi:hypothetical protein
MASDGQIETEAPVPAAFELFEPGECNPLIPLNPIVDGFIFTRFIGLVADTAVGTHKVVVPRTLVMPEFALALATADPDATVLDAQGGLALTDLSNTSALLAPLARPTLVDSIDKLLAEGALTVDQQEVEVQLEEGGIRNLLAGRDAVVKAIDTVNSTPTQSQPPKAGPKVTPFGPAQLLRLVVAPDPENRPAAAETRIGDLAAFLARPQVLGVDGRPIPLQLTAAQVAALRNDGHVDVQVGESTVTLLVTQECDPGTSSTSELSVRTTALSRAFSSTSIARAASEPIEGELTGFESAAVVTIPSEPPRFNLALQLVWIQRWQLKGYSRGVLLNTMSLTPQEETTIEIFTWDRRKFGREWTSSKEEDNSYEKSDTTRDTTDVLNETQSSHEFSSDVDGTFKVEIEDVLDLGLGGSAGTKDRVVNTSKSSTNFVHESVVKSANKVKQSRQTKVTESVEIGREERVTHKLRNPNMCTSLNLDFFEILANYEVTTTFRPDLARLCLLIENPIKLIQFDRLALRVYEQPLRRALLDRDFTPGFAAARLLYARQRACEVASECCCPKAVAPIGGDTLPPAIAAELALVASFMNSLLDTTLFVWFDLIERQDFAAMSIEGLIAEARRAIYARFLQVGAPGLHLMLAQTVKQRRTNSAFQPLHAERLRFELKAAGGPQAITPTALFNKHQQVIEHAIQNEYDGAWRPISPNKDVIPEVKDNIVGFIYATGLFDTFDDNGLVFGLSRFVDVYDAEIKAQDTQKNTEYDWCQQATDAVQSTFGLREVSEALERETALITHLNAHTNYYRWALWKALTPASQSALLQPILPRGGVAPHALGLVGDRLAFPVNLDAVPGAKQLVKEIIEENSGLDDLSLSASIPLPTSSVTMESRLGTCDACESFIQDSRALELRTRAAQATHTEATTDLVKEEVRRYKARVDASPPVLDDPRPETNPIRVSIEQPPSTP